MSNKAKTNKSAKKRFKITGNGKIKHFKGWKSHLLTHKNSKRKRKLRQPEILKKADVQRVRDMLPNG